MQAAAFQQRSYCAVAHAGETIPRGARFLGQTTTRACHGVQCGLASADRQKARIRFALSSKRAIVGSLHRKLLPEDRQNRHRGCGRVSASGDSVGVPLENSDNAGRSESAGEAEGEGAQKKGGFLGWMQQHITNQRAASAELLAKIQSFGVAGVLSYGLFNTLYYIGAFLFVWIYVVKVPRGLGVLAASQKFVSVMAIVWAGSQLTKLVRAGGALLCAPLMDRLIDATQRVFSLRQRSHAFAAICGVCWVLFVVLFTAIILIWA